MPSQRKQLNTLDRVSSEVKDVLDIKWTAKQMLAYLDETYSSVENIKFEDVFESYLSLETDSSDDPSEYYNRVRKISSQLTTLCKAHEITTSDQLIKLLDVLFMMRGLHDTQKIFNLMNAARRSNKDSENSNPIAGNTAGVNRRNNKQNNQQNQQQGGRRNSHGDRVTLCIRCWGTEHTMRECQNQPRPFPGFANSPQDPNIGGSTVKVCFKCWQSGHTQYGCSNERVEFPRMITRLPANSAISTREGSRLGSEVLIDSGCAWHMSDQKSLMVDLRPDSAEISGIKDVCTRATHRGTLKCMLDGKELVIPNVLYVPGLKRTLLSEAQLHQQGFQVYNRDGNKLLQVGNGSWFIPPVNNVYPVYVQPYQKPIRVNVSTTLKEKTLKWHVRLGHPSIARMKQSMPTEAFDVDFICGDCHVANIIEMPYHSSTSPLPLPGEEIHFDLIGPYRTAGLDGNNMMLVAKDKATRYAWGFLLKNEVTNSHHTNRVSMPKSHPTI
ncbi:hypothetical protein SeLEV6574_g08441 [Synchytrium endobioticum]|uniref:CCHC-type domain-containing protein n=1 Tax=Synchytrium endobioticum TaxID=286115 RepID=A0A507BZA9_9FUNG|nr:hypothetical protein SeLEV6574_g08441 [Synchytrium endobioticum]